MNIELKKQLDFIDKLRNLSIVYYENKVPTFCVVTFGCQMNAKDSEKLEGILIEAGLKKEENEENADIVIFNTCTVRENANERLYGRIGQLKNSYLNNKKKIIGICGCMMQEPDEVINIKNKYPQVRLVFGTYNIYELPELLYEVMESDKRVFKVYDKPQAIVEDLPQDKKYSFKCGVNIMYGCNNFCSYCIVPYVRGRERSRNFNDIIDEVKKLSKDGIVEVMLLGQNVNSYGNDFEIDEKKGHSFPNLLKAVSEVEGIKRVRFMTSHPKDLSDELIDVIKNNDKICKHIHLPVQSGSNEILNKMNRKYTREYYIDLVNKIKNNIKDVSITTDIIVGFPGETEKDFNDTIDLIKEVNFDSVFTFIYSKRTGTKASEMPNQIDEETKKIRFDKLLKTIDELNKNRFIDKIGKIDIVLVEDLDKEEGFVTGRLSNNILVHFKGDKSYIGKFKKVKLIESKGFYFIGEEYND